KKNKKIKWKDMEAYEGGGEEEEEEEDNSFTSLTVPVIPSFWDAASFLLRRRPRSAGLGTKYPVRRNKRGSVGPSDPPPLSLPLLPLPQLPLLPLSLRLLPLP